MAKSRSSLKSLGYANEAFSHTNTQKKKENARIAYSGRTTKTMHTMPTNKRRVSAYGHSVTAKFSTHRKPRQYR